MAEGTLEDYVNVKLKELSLAEINETYQPEQYPLVARNVPRNYEIPNMADLPGRVEVLLEKPKEVQYVLVRVCQYFDKEEKIKEKGFDYVEERNKYVGKEYLLPAQYSNNVTLINKPGRHRRYVSLTQVIEDLPRLIKTQQEISCMTTEGESATITKETILEVKSVEIPPLQNERHVVCKVNDVSYELPESTPINCVAVDDKQLYKLDDVASSMLLPKTVQFVEFLPESVLLQDDDQAHLLSILVSGPLKLLKLRRRRVFVVWLKKEEFYSQRVGVIPEEGWKCQTLTVPQFADEQKKTEYVQSHFGDQINSSFVENGFYNMRPVETDVIFLLVPKKTKRASKPALLDYENVDLENSKEDDSDDDSYEEPVSSIPPEDMIPVLPPRLPVKQDFNDGEVRLPLNKPKKEDILNKIREKARLGFDKVHEQLLRRVKAIEGKASKGRPKTKVLKKSASEPKNRFSRSVEIMGKEHNRKETFVDRKHGRQQTASEPTNRSSRSVEREGEGKEHAIYERKETVVDRKHGRLSKGNIGRPLPEIPITPQNGVSIDKERNRTDDDKIDMGEHHDTMMDYDYADDVNVRKKVCEQGYLLMEPQSPKLESDDSKTETLKKLPDFNKVGRQNQTKEDFYQYTVEEITECFKMCGLHKMATLCCEETLDGAFFRNFNLESLQDGPFFLSKMEVLKMKKIIEDGWRPKLEKEKGSIYYV